MAEDRLNELAAEKLQAEVAKLRAEAVHIRRWSGLSEFLKVFGAILATLAAIYAAITTYRITQLETRLAQYEKDKAEQQRIAAVAARDSAVRALAEAVAARSTAERRLIDARDAVRKIQADEQAAVASKSAAEGAMSRAVMARAASESQAAQAIRTLRAAEVQKVAAEREVRVLQQKVEEARRQLATAGGEATDPAMVLAVDEVSEKLGVAAERAGRNLPMAVIRYKDENLAEEAEGAALLFTVQGYRAIAAFSPTELKNNAATSVRFFHAEDSHEAQKMRDSLARAGLTINSVTRAPAQAVARRYYEVWLHSSATTQNDSWLDQTGTMGP
ncbi:MAG TPA: hypothetical protein VF618_00995 [Thermoanaerobaculia bacterium]